MRILFIGDIVGKPGRQMLESQLTKIRHKYKPDMVIVNGENAAGGKGLTEKIYKQFLEWGVHVVTMGNHTWDNKNIFDFIDRADHIVRPGNYPEGTPGKGLTIHNIQKQKVAVINLQGTVFLPSLEDPFRKADALIEEARKETSFIFVDFHGEATSEKQAMGWYLDGRVSAIVGTHTHVQTADNRILPGQTAYISDVGMTGPYDGILGMSRKAVIKKFLTQMPVRFDVEDGRQQLSSVIVDVDDRSAKATAIQRLLINDDHLFFE